LGRKGKALQEGAIARGGGRRIKYPSMQGWGTRHLDTGTQSLADEGERDSRVRKKRIHPFEFCFKPVLKMSQITSVDSLGLFDTSSSQTNWVLAPLKGS